MTFYELIRACEKAKTQAEIKALLQEHKGNKEIKELFRLMLDKGILYNIKKVPCIEPSEGDDIITDDETLIIKINKLLQADLRGDPLKTEVQYLYDWSDLYQAEVFCWILDRKNPAKVGKSFVNGVWPGLIRVQEYMGAVPGTEKALEKLPWAEGVAVQNKEDGMACLVSYENGIPQEIRTRQGQDITKYFPEFFSSLPIVQPSFNSTVHHELFVYDTEAEEMLDRKTGNGLISKQVKNGTIGGSVDYSTHSVVLDLYSDAPQEQRYHVLNLFVTLKTSRVHEIIMYDLQEARAYARTLILLGLEGVICKDRSKPFKQGKPTCNVKIKNEFKVELVCTGYKKSEIKGDRFKSLRMESEDGVLVVHVGSGLTPEMRRTMHPDEYYLEVFEVTAESIIKSKGKKKPSLYLARFERDDAGELPLRWDKEKADTYKQIKAQESASKEVKDGVPTD